MATVQLHNDPGTPPRPHLLDSEPVN
jgi:hypothetical protein